MNDPGCLFQKLKSQKGKLLLAFYVFLAALFILNAHVRPDVPHFGLDSLPGFYAAFGFLTGGALICILNRIIAPLIGGKKEDFHGDV